MIFPVEAKLDELRSALAAGRDVVLTAPPGSGKTTCVPPALLDEPWLAGKKIVMLEPRRLAARNCASYIASKLRKLHLGADRSLYGERPASLYDPGADRSLYGERPASLYELGGLVGYQVRLERKISSATRLEVVTEGLLTQRILSDPELADVGLIIFDEFHERSLQCDLAYALALEVKRAFRPDLRLIVMSATLDADEVLRSLASDKVNLASPQTDPNSTLTDVNPTLIDPMLIRAEGRMFPVETRYLGDMSMSAAIDKALAETDGDILCFLPGEGEIRSVEGRVKSAELRNVEVLPLYGSLQKEYQDKIFRPRPDSIRPQPDSIRPQSTLNDPISTHRRVILATSIAETSLTIEGITTVIDSGLMRVPRFSPSTGMSGLVTLPLTLDRAEQRRGRAGRVRAGVCYRLWSEAAEASRPKKMMPEILDADLCSLVLTSCVWGALRREDLPWMTPPPASAWDQAVSLLKLLGALDDRGNLTPKGEAMAKLAMHPRLAAMQLGVRSEELGVEDDKVALYAAIIEEGSRSRETDIRYVPLTPRIKQLAKRFTHHHSSFLTSNSSLRPEAALALAYPDRVAKNRGNGTFTMVSGRGAFLPEDDPLSREPYLVCCELDDRPGDAKIFLACPILESEIESLFSDRIVEEPFCEWDRRSERVKSVVKRKLGAMTLSERPDSPPGKLPAVPSRRSSESASLSDLRIRALLDGIRQKGVENLPCWTKETLQLKARINFLWKLVDDERILSALPGFVDGMTKWKDLEKLDIAAVMDFILAESGHDRRELDRLAPVRMEVPSGSHMLIHYEGDEPTCEVRLQECFGLMSTPKVAGGKTPVVMTLLSPAQRPCAVTKDLASFWKEGYPLVRKDLRGRYPKHYWPEDPFTAVATRRVRPR